MQPDGFSPDRRRVLAAIGGLGILGASGCCALRPYPAQGLIGTGPVSEATRILAPGPLQQSSLKPRFAIDVHAHFFNASDVNVAGFLEYAVAHTMQEPLRSFVKMMGPVLDDLAGYATTAADEYNELLRMTKAISLLDAGAYGSALDTTIAARRDHIADRLYESMKKHGADARYIELRQQYFRALDPQGTASAVFSAAMVREALEPKNRLQPLSPAIRAQVLSGTTFDPNGVIQFVGYMLQDRWMNLRTYLRSYSVDEGAFGVDAAFGSLVDFDYWLDCPAHSARQDQMKVQSLISLLSDGYMLPLVSYNPWTDIKRDGESLQLVQDAITRYGFIGVKIYPPMGFYPYGNEDNPVSGT